MLNLHILVLGHSVDVATRLPAGDADVDSGIHMQATSQHTPCTTSCGARALYNESTGDVASGTCGQLEPCQVHMRLPNRLHPGSDPDPSLTLTPYVILTQFQPLILIGLTFCLAFAPSLNF